VNLHGRGLRAQREAFRRVEGVERVTRRMIFRDVERREVVEIRLNLAVVLNRIA
jgi:hypothetical protein